MRILFEPVVVTENGGNKGRKYRIPRICCVVEAILAIRVGVVKKLTFRRSEEAVGLAYRIEVDDCHFLEHLFPTSHKTGYSNPEMFVILTLSYLCCDEPSLAGVRDAGVVISQGFADEVGVHVHGAWTVWWGVDGRAGAVVKGGKAMDVKVYGLPR